MAAVPDVDLAKIRKYCEDKTPPQFRNKMRVETGVRGKSITIFECRPPWHEVLDGWSRMPIGQLRYNSADRHWTLYGLIATAVGTSTT